MNCPYCFDKMEEGTIHTDCWISNNENTKLPFLHKRIKLTGGWDSPPYVDAFFCSTCKKIIINLDK